MSNNLPLAQEFAYSLAISLMACVTLFRSEGGYGAVPTAEFEGDDAIVVHVYDPWEA